MLKKIFKKSNCMKVPLFFSLPRNISLRIDRLTSKAAFSSIFLLASFFYLDDDMSDRSKGEPENSILPAYKMYA